MIAEGGTERGHGVSIARRGTPGWHVLGRETFLAPVDWRDGWPVVGDLSIVEPDGTVTALGTLDGRYLSTEVAGGFTGRVIGMYAAAGTVHVDWFDYRPVALAASAAVTVR